MSNGRGQGFVAWVAAVAALGALCAGCGGGSSSPAARSQTTGASAQAQPVSDFDMVSGSSERQITQTIVAFYRAAWQNDAARACSLFSPDGVAGFMRAAKTSFPASVNQYSTCTKAMEIYNATLSASVADLQQSDPAVDGNVLNHVKVGDIKIDGGSATALAPLNTEPMVNPKRIRLVRTGGRWLIDGSQSLSKSNLPKILAQARKDGALKPKK